MSDIFISYASADRPVAQRFAHAFENCGWSVWWDREIPVGKSFDQVIEEELNAARCVVVLWSKAAVRSRWVKAESGAAADRERLVPVLIDDAAIPLEFNRIQTAMLVNWSGDVEQPEFRRLVEAVKEFVARPETAAAVTPRKNAERPRPASMPRISPRLVGAAAVVLLVIAGFIFAKKLFQNKLPENSPPVANGVATGNAPPSGTQTNRSASPSRAPTDNAKAAAPKGAFAIKIGDRIDDGVPAPGAGSIESPYAQDVYSFPATAGQQVYFRMLRHSNGLAYIRWRLTDPDGMEVFNACFGCNEPGVQSLTKAGNYNLTVGSDNDASTGTYQLQLFNVPPPGRFSIKIGDQIKENTPGAGAGMVESPGAEDIYTFTASPRQNVYFRMLESSNGMSYIRWRLVDENAMEVFNACLGCNEPGVQTLVRGGTYTLTVGNRTDPSTGTYRLQLFDVPAPNQFSIKIGDRIRSGSPGAGAGSIESPGAEDVYLFSAAAGQKVYFHLLDRDKGMDYIKWRLVDENNAEVFNTCLGCNDPGVQTLTRGGKYSLIVGNRTNPATGNYAFETGAR